LHYCTLTSWFETNEIDFSCKAHVGLGSCGCDDVGEAEVNRGEKNAQEYFLGNSTFKLNPWWLAVLLIFHHLFFCLPDLTLVSL